MKISILYFAGCPNHPPTVEMVRRVVAERGMNTGVELVEVSADDVVRHRFLGSPTVQVDGVDIEPAARDRTSFSMSCRVYGTPDGLPSQEMLLDALGVGNPTAATPTSDRAGVLAIGGSVVTAILSSACCWLPLILLTFGASFAGASAFFERWRPLLVSVAVVMLALGLYFSYFRKTACAEGCCGTRPKQGRRIQRATLWGSVAVVTAFVFFPNYIGVLLGSPADAGQVTAASTDNAGPAYFFDVKGMHCAACATTLRSELVKLDGVTDVLVDYDSKTARVNVNADADLGAAERRIADGVAEAATRLGYSATLRSQK